MKRMKSKGKSAEKTNKTTKISKNKYTKAILRTGKEEIEVEKRVHWEIVKEKSKVKKTTAPMV